MWTSWIKCTYRDSWGWLLSMAFNSLASLGSPTNGASRAVMTADQLQVLVLFFQESKITEKHWQVFPPHSLVQALSSPTVIPSWRPMCHNFSGIFTATLFIRSQSSGSLSMDITLLAAVWLTNGIVWIMKGHQYFIHDCWMNKFHTTICKSQLKMTQFLRVLEVSIPKYTHARNMRVCPHPSST